MNQSSGAKEARLYLAALFEGAPGDSLIEVRCPKREPRIQQFFPVREIEAAATFVAGWARATDVYVGVAPRVRTKGKRPGGKDAVDLVQALWADCDTTSAITVLAGFVPIPTIEVASGGGVHAYWILDAPVPKEQAEICNRRLALALGADRSATDCAHVLRPPGTFNHKPQRRVDGAPAPVTLRALIGVRYPWDEVVGALPDPAAPPRRTIPARAVRRGEDPLFTIAPPVYVELLSGRKVGRDGKALCPFHPDVNPSLHAFPDPEDGWWCFGCKRGGDIITFGALLFGIEPRGGGYFRVRREIAARLRERAA